MANFLLIEDHLEHQKLIVYLLQRFGHRVRGADTGEEGLEIALREAFDLIICDIHLPGIDGYQLANHLINNPLWRKAPLIAVTALAMVGDRDKVLISGFDGYLSKPISPQTFAQQIESYLPNKRQQPPHAINIVSSPVV